MTTIVKRLTLTVFALAVLAASCGRLGDDDPGPGDDPGIAHPTGSDDLILRIDTGGGFVPASFLLTDIPELTLTGDGRLIVQGPQIELYPGPALPSLLQRRVSEEGIQAILEAAREAGLLGPDHHYGNNCVADAGTTTFTLVAEGRTHTISAYALELDVPGQVDCLDDPSDLEARAALSEFRLKMGDLASWLPAGSFGEEEAFEFDELRIYPERAEPGSVDEGIEPQVKDWPLGTPLSGFGEATPNAPAGERCGTVSGAELETLVAELRTANELTLWESGGETYRLYLRPLMPDESGCPEA